MEDDRGTPSSFCTAHTSLCAFTTTVRRPDCAASSLLPGSNTTRSPSCERNMPEGSSAHGRGRVSIHPVPNRKIGLQRLAAPRFVTELHPGVHTPTHSCVCSLRWLA
jgi:hypothetical protein